MVFNMCMPDMPDMLSSSCQVLERDVLLVVYLVASLTIYLQIMTPLASGFETLSLSAPTPRSQVKQPKNLAQLSTVGCLVGIVLMSRYLFCQDLRRLGHLPLHRLPDPVEGGYHTML